MNPARGMMSSDGMGGKTFSTHISPTIPGSPRMCSVCVTQSRIDVPPVAMPRQAGESNLSTLILA